MLSKILSISLVVILIAFEKAHGQDSPPADKPKAEFSGFFRAEAWYDTRQVPDMLDGLFHLFPLPRNLDANGNDINAQPSLNASVLATRLRTNISMPKLFNAKSSILVEIDFTGMHTMAHVRFRHGLARLVWEQGTELMLGQTWHPMFVTEVFPHVAGLSTGAPFQSFNRSPQVTIRQSLGGGLRGIVSVITHGDFKSYGYNGQTGNIGYSSIPLRQGVVPNLHAQLQYTGRAVTLGVALDFKSIKPRLSTSPPVVGSTTKYITNERLNGLSGMVYLRVQSGLLTSRLKGMYGQNLADHLMLGGYAVSTFDSITGRETYTPLSHVFGYLNITYGKTFMPGLFVGYAKNLGAASEVVEDVNRLYGRGVEIDYLFRVSPNFTYRSDRLTLIVEVEHTYGSFGTNDMTNKAIVVNATDVANTRFHIVAQWDF